MQEIEWQDYLLEPQRDAELERRFAQMTSRIYAVEGFRAAPFAW